MNPVDESNRVRSRRLAKLGRQITVLGHKETSRPDPSLEFQKDVHRHLIYGAPRKAGTAHVPGRRVHGFDLNGLRHRAARLNEQEVFLAIRKLHLESASQQFADHKIFARWNARLSLPPIDSSSRSSLNPLEPRSQAVESRRTAIAVEVLRRAPSLLASHPFVARGGALGGRGVAHGDRFAAPAAVASRGSRWPQRAQRRAQPPVLRPPTAPAPPTA